MSGGVDKHFSGFLCDILFHLIILQNSIKLIQLYDIKYI